MRKKERFVLGKRTFRSQKSKHFVLRIIYYKRYHRNGWNRILVEIGIKPGSMYYDPFYDRIRYHSECWREHYCSYCDHHDKHHRKHYKKHKRHKHHKWHDDDDDWDDDDEDD